MSLTETARIRIRGTVTQFPYSRKRITDAFMVVKGNPRMRDLEQELARAASARVDNKTVYAITADWRAGVVIDGMEIRANSGALYIWFHDLDVYFGHTIEDL